MVLTKTSYEVPALVANLPPQSPAARRSNPRHCPHPTPSLRSLDGASAQTYCDGSGNWNGTGPALYNCGLGPTVQYALNTSLDAKSAAPLKGDAR